MDARNSTDTYATGEVSSLALTGEGVTRARLDDSPSDAGKQVAVADAIAKASDVLCIQTKR